MIIFTFSNMKKDIETLLDQALTGQLLERPQVEELRCSFHSIGGAAALPAILHADRHKEGLRLCLRSSMLTATKRRHGGAAALPAILHASLRKKAALEGLRLCLRSSMLTTLSSTPTGITACVAF